VEKAGIFGSYARGEQRKESDIDIIIEPPKNMGIEFVTLNYELEDALKKKVDLITYKGINPRIKKYVLNDEVRIYGSKE
ncbi:MAG: nucleotidyltransferase domain-containing protein, partial [Nanoarchaeota archaeon]